MKKLDTKALETVSGGCCVVAPKCGAGSNNDGCGQPAPAPSCGPQKNSCCS